MTVTLHKGANDGKWHIGNTYNSAICGEDVFGTDIKKIGHDGVKFLKEPPQYQFCTTCFPKK